MKPDGFIDALVTRHLDAAYNLARWLLGSSDEAADAVHEAFVRARTFSGSYAGGNARAWWLAIVRNCCLARIAQRQRERRHIVADADSGAGEAACEGAENGASVQEDSVASAQRHALIATALAELPVEFREALVLREIEDLSYREIAQVLAVPIGTVMSRLARARALLRRHFETISPGELTHGL